MTLKTEKVSQFELVECRKRTKIVWKIVLMFDTLIVLNLTTFITLY